MKKLIFFNFKPIKALALSLILANLAQANPTTSNDTVLTRQQIGEKAIAYVSALFPAPEVGELSYDAVPLDPRIKIKPCLTPLQLTIPGNANLSKRTTVQVSCQSGKNWHLYVQIKITRMIPVVVAKSNMAPGTVITQNNIITLLKDASQIRGRALRQPDQLFGAKTSRYVTAGQAVTLRKVCLVCKGDMVTVVAKLKGLRVKTSGISQQNGSLGDNIAILNNRTSKRIEARVVAVNRVEISI